MGSAKLFNSLSLIAYLLFVFLTPINSYGNIFLNIFLLVVWLLISIRIDRGWIKSSKFYFVLLLCFVSLDVVLSLSLSNMLILMQSISGKTLAYFSFVFFLFYRRHLNLLKVPLIVLLGAICVTGIFTYIGNINFPNASRALADPSNPEKDFYKSMFIGGYEYIYSLVFLVMPLLMVAKEKGFSANFRLFAFLVLLFGITNIVVASYFIGIILTLVSVLLTFVNTKNVWKALTTFSMVAILLLLLKDIILEWFISLGEEIHSQMLIKRASQILYDTYEEDQGNESRLVIYGNAILNFIQSPIWGKLMGESVYRRAGHSGLLEYLSNYGLLSVVYFHALYQIYIKTKRSFTNHSVGVYYIIYFVLAIIFFTIDIFDYSPHISTIVFFIAPCMLLMIDKVKLYESSLANK